MFRLKTPKSRGETTLGPGGNDPPKLKKKKIIIYMCINFSNFVIENYILFSFNNIIVSFKSNVILTNFFITFFKHFW